MTKIHLLDHRSEIFQTFSGVSQLYSFCNRQTRHQKGKTIVVLNETKARAYNLGEESPAEIMALTLKLMNDIR